jgi:hypothetical protein
MRIIFGIIIFATFICNHPAYGQAVPDAILNEVAVNLMTENFPGGARKIKSVIKLTYDNINTLNLFELDPEGWILLSADKKVKPVIGFSFTGQFKEPEENLNDPMFYWLNMYRKQIKEIVNDESLKVNSEWDKRSKTAPSESVAAGSVRVTPFMKVNWGQGKNWNQFCPLDPAGPGGHVYVGCVAVSMAQAMSIYKIPEKGQGYNNYLDPKYGTQYVNFGETFYYWDSMSVSIADKFNSLLLYHCAVAVNMDFGADGSGAQTLDAASALRNYYSFSHQLLYKNRTGTDKTWQDILNGELLKGRPVIYSGDADDGNPGHAFNLDGVINDSYYHINWGWSGSSNGYFTLDALNAGSTNFNKNQSAIIGIRPFYYPTDIKLSDSIVHKLQPPGTMVGFVNVIDEASDNSYTFKLSCDSTYNGREWIMDYFLVGDSLKAGRIFASTEHGLDTISISVRDKFNNSLTKPVIVSIGGSTTDIYLPEDAHNEDLIIFPNPAFDHISIRTKTSFEIISLRIYTISGVLVTNIYNPDPSDIIPVSTLAKGFYILESELASHKIIYQKFIKQ